MNGECDDMRVALGALAVGALEPDAEQRVREHLDRCPACTAEADALTDTARALALLDPTEIGTTAVPSPDLLPALLARVRTIRRRQRMVRLAAAAVAVVLAGVGGLVWGARSPDQVAAAPVVSASGSEQGVALQVDAWDKGWGTAVQARVSGVPSGYRCRLVAVGSDGTREVAATWQVPSNGYDDSGTLTVDGAVGLRSWDVDRYEVVTVDGDTLVTAPRE